MYLSEVTYVVMLFAMILIYSHLGAFAAIEVFVLEQPLKRGDVQDCLSVGAPLDGNMVPMVSAISPGIGMSPDMDTVIPL